MFTKWYVLTVLAALLQLSAYGQGFTVSGTLLDETDNSSLIGVSVVLSPTSDTSLKYGGVTDLDGKFSVANIPAGAYSLKASYVGFQNYSRNVNVTGNTDLGTIRMKVLSTQLQNVTVTAEQIRAQQSGDTTSFNAGAYKTNPDANAEDLINKMPGISTEGGTIKAQGEDVKQVLVDGKPFFGDDPNAAIKNLPAEIIDRIQVFDKLSDQAQLTGFDDGSGQKTINIITKPGRNTGQFGKVYGGYGTRDLNFKDNFYVVGGNLNYFKGDTRVSLIGLSNNVNQQNFSTDDLLGAVNSSSGQSRGGSGGSRGGGRGGPRGGRSGGSGGRGGGDISNFLVGQQEGITTTHSVGLNYSDEWSEKIKVTGSYFFNFTENTNANSLSRTYLTEADNNLIYKEHSSRKSTNINHRANLRLEYEIDSMNTLIFTPRISFQDNSNERSLNGTNRLPDSSFVSGTSNENISNTQGYNFGTNLLYRHKFAKKGRSMSVNGSVQLNNRTGDGTIASQTLYADTLLNDTLDQRYDLSSDGNTYSGNVTYTEPLGEKRQLMINYAPSFTQNHSTRLTYDRLNGSSEYDLLNTQLSNKFDNTYASHRGGLSYRSNTEKTNFMAGLNYQYASLKGMQELPPRPNVEKSFSNILPQASYNYKFTRSKNLRIMYRTATNAPSIQQLQDVVDITNPLLLRTGNADLEQNYQHTLMFRYGNTNTATSTSFFAMLYGSYTMDYIANQTLIPTKDSVYGDVILPRGSQLTRPVNLDGYWSARSFLTYGMPVRAIKSNLNLNAGVNYSKIPGLINTSLNYSNNLSFNGGAVLSSNISENLDFTLAYSGYYNVVKNSIQTQSDNNYYNQNTSFRINWIFLDRFVANTSLNHTLYSGLSEGFNQSYLLWNAALGYKFLADKSLDVRLTAYDILNQNRSIERTVTETYIEDSYTNVLQRYFMLNVTYTLRRFGGAAAGRNNTTDVVEPAEGATPRERGNRGNRQGGGGNERQ